MANCKCGCGREASKDFIKGHNTWKGGRYVHQGYILIYTPDHPRANQRGYVREHILVAEKAFNRVLLLDEEIHHIDGNRTNNEIGNLIVFKTKAMHIAYHHRLAAFEACGHYNWRKCKYCHKYDEPNKLIFVGNGVYHQSCRRNYKNNWRQERRNLFGYTT